MIAVPADVGRKTMLIIGPFLSVLLVTQVPPSALSFASDAAAFGSIGTQFICGGCLSASPARSVTVITALPPMAAASANFVQLDLIMTDLLSRPAVWPSLP